MGFHKPVAGINERLTFARPQSARTVNPGQRAIDRCSDPRLTMTGAQPLSHRRVQGQVSENMAAALWSSWVVPSLLNEQRRVVV